MEKATQSNRNNNPPSGLLSWISRRGFWLLFVSATLLAIAATWFAAQQKPHPDAFRVTAPWHNLAAWFSADFWLHPYERNAFKRLPVIRSDLRDVFVLGERVWAVGDGGLIIHSPDGGVTWQQQRAYQPESLESVEENPQRQRMIAPEADQQLESNAQGISRTEGRLSDSEKLFREDLQSIFFIDAQRGWAVGSGGTILSTNDGGKNWQLQSNNTETSLVDNDEMNLSIADEEKDQHLTYQRFPAPWFYLILLVIALLYVAAFGLRARQNRQAQQQPASIAYLGVSDQPAGPGRADLVGARRVALGLTRFLTNENTQPPLTIAITGEWGSGKSSVMNYLFANLKRKGLRPVWFNAWHHREE
ncbi:MAG: P-loop NTPase fold protein [Nitrosomonas sp.]|nr:P-loop NTPase fold protein [Nitrosomonas sp.]